MQEIYTQRSREEKKGTRRLALTPYHRNLSPLASLRSGRRTMKVQFVVSTGILLLALLPCRECRALSKSVPGVAVESALQQPDYLREQTQSLPILLRMGEEYFLRLGNLHKNAAAASSFASSSSSSSSGHLAASAATGNFFRAVVQQLQQLQGRSLEGAAAAAAAEPWDSDDSGAQLDEPGQQKRSEEPPISLDLTFHLLREVLEMARAEQLAQQAHSNRKLMEIIGK